MHEHTPCAACGAVRPRVSVIVPALHEAATIGQTLAHILRLAGEEKIQVLVADGDPAGSTLAAVQQLGEPRCQGLLAPRGRARQMNAAAAQATGQALLFLHADTRLPDGALDLLTTALRYCPAGAFDLAIDSPRPSLWLNGLLSSTRSRLTRVPYGDQAHFFRADYFRQLGGYADIPLMEDVEIMRRMARQGDAVAILPARARTSARRWEKEGELRVSLRNWWLMSRYLLGASPHDLVRHYRSHGE